MFDWVQELSKLVCIIIVIQVNKQLLLHERCSISLKIELLHKTKKEWTGVLQCYSKFHGPPAVELGV